MIYWYIFSTIPNSNPLDPASYSYPYYVKPSCPGSVKLCAIRAYDDGFGQPVITDEIVCEIIVALQYGLDQTNVVLRF